MVQLAREHRLITVADNTFLSPYFQHPLDLGVNVVVHSTTKYLNGHSDVVGGAVITGRHYLAERLAPTTPSGRRESRREPSGSPSGSSTPMT